MWCCHTLGHIKLWPMICWRWIWIKSRSRLAQKKNDFHFRFDRSDTPYQSISDRNRGKQCHQKGKKNLWFGFAFRFFLEGKCRIAISKNSRCDITRDIHVTYAWHTQDIIFLIKFFFWPKCCLVEVKNNVTEYSNAVEDFKKKGGSSDIDNFDETAILGKTKELGAFVTLGKEVSNVTWHDVT